MHCFLNLKPIKVISFDLDDTLYDNRPYIKKAESEFLNYMQQHFPAEHGWSSEFWRQKKQQLERQDPSLSHDTWRVRQVTARHLLMELGYDEAKAEQGATDGLNHFLLHRSDFSVPTESIELLKQLAKEYRLIGISNGNVDSNKIGLKGLFEFVLHAGNGLKMKPAPDLFDEACTRLGVKADEVLHVGDNFGADVVGARTYGCQAAWLNPAYGRDEKQQPDSLLPHLSLNNVHQLTQLVNR